MHLRFASVRDAAEIAAIYSPVVESTAISFEAVAPGEAEMRARIGGHPADKPWIVAANDDGDVGGYAYASAFRSRTAYRFGAEVTVYVAEHARRGGVGRMLYRALLDVLRLQGYRRAYAGIALPNDPSIALHERLGFTAAGIVHAAGYKFGRWHDLAFFECALAPLDVPAHDPLEVTNLDAAATAAIFTTAARG